MAYVDASNTTRLNPAGAAATVGINLLFLVGIASMTPHVAAIIDERTRVTIENSEPTQPLKMPDAATPELPVAPPTLLQQRHDHFVPVLPPLDLPSGIDPVIPEPPTPPYVPPVAIPQPVITTPRYDTRFASAMQPEYPISLARAEIEGSAVVNVLVGADGRVKDVVSIRSDDPGFFEATRNHALRKWRFKPATRDGVPVEGWRQMTVRFQMPDRFD